MISPMPVDTLPSWLEKNPDNPIPSQFVEQEIKEVVRPPKKCKWSGEMFTPSRGNQKFASAKNRCEYHNYQIRSSKIGTLKSGIDKKLSNNFSVLRMLMGDNKEKIVHSEFLRGSGYNLEMFTHIQKFENHNHNAIYDFILIKKGEEYRVINYLKK